MLKGLKKFFGIKKKKIKYEYNSYSFSPNQAKKCLNFIKDKRKLGENFEYIIEVKWSDYELFCIVFKEVISQKEVIVKPF